MNLHLSTNYQCWCENQGTYQVQQSYHKMALLMYELNSLNMYCVRHGSLNVPIEHHPTIRYVVYNGYYKVMSNIPKMGQLPTPVRKLLINHWMSMRLGEPYFLTTSLQNQRLWPLENSLVWMGFLRWASWIPPIYRAKPMISSSNGWFYTSFKRQTQYALFRHWISVFHDEIQKIKVW